MENIRDVIKRNCVRLLDKGQHGMTLKEIARQTGVSETTLQRWKNGENTPEVDNISKLAEILGIDPLEFFKPKIEKPQGDSFELIQKIASLGPTEMELLKDTLESLTKPIKKAGSRKDA